MKNLLDYQDKRVIVVGCYSGMGESTARIVGELGAEVVAVDIKKPSVDHSKFFEVDCRDPIAIEAVVGEIAGAGPIDSLFYCAGLPGGSFSNVDVMSVNFLGLRHMVEACVPHMKRGDSIATISSGAGMAYMMVLDRLKELLALTDHAKASQWVKDADAEGGLEGYSFSKMCTIAYTLHRGPLITQETGVRINCISPGPTDTPMMPHFVENVGKTFMDNFPKPIGRNSTADEQAWVLAFLNSAAASYISGENLFTDGGTSAGLMTGSIDMSKLSLS